MPDFRSVAGSLRHDPDGRAERVVPKKSSLPEESFPTFDALIAFTAPEGTLPALASGVLCS